METNSLFTAFSAAVRKNIGYVLIVLLVLIVYFVSIATGVGLLSWYSQHISLDTQIIIGWMALFCSFLILNTLFIFSTQRLVTAGNIVSSSSTGNLTTSQILAAGLIFHCVLTMVTAWIYNIDRIDVIRQNTIWWIAAIFFSVYSFFSFEFRQKGMVYRGKVILFPDIEHAQWVNLKDKTKLKIRLRGTGQEFIVKTPWKLITPIDDYVRANFPRP